LTFIATLGFGVKVLLMASLMGKQLMYNPGVFGTPVTISSPSGWPIFFWQSVPSAASESPYWWLLAHLLSATVLLRFARAERNHGAYSLRHIASAVMFAFLIIINCHHFGQFSTGAAIATNLTPLGLAMVALIHQVMHERSDYIRFAYFFFASSPVLFEVLVALSSRL